MGTRGTGMRIWILLKPVDARKSSYVEPSYREVRRGFTKRSRGGRFPRLPDAAARARELRHPHANNHSRLIL